MGPLLFDHQRTIQLYRPALAYDEVPCRILHWQIAQSPPWSSAIHYISMFHFQCDALTLCSHHCQLVCLAPSGHGDCLHTSGGCSPYGYASWLVLGTVGKITLHWSRNSVQMTTCSIPFPCNQADPGRRRTAASVCRVPNIPSRLRSRSAMLSTRPKRASTTLRRPDWLLLRSFTQVKAGFHLSTPLLRYHRQSPPA